MSFGLLYHLVSESYREKNSLGVGGGGGLSSAQGVVIVLFCELAIHLRV